MWAINTDQQDCHKRHQPPSWKLQQWSACSSSPYNRANKDQAYNPQIKSTQNRSQLKTTTHEKKKETTALSVLTSFQHPSSQDGLNWPWSHLQTNTKNFRPIKIQIPKWKIRIRRNWNRKNQMGFLRRERKIEETARPERERERAKKGVTTVPCKIE